MVRYASHRCPGRPASLIAAVRAITLLLLFGMTPALASAVESTHVSGTARTGLSAPYAYHATGRTPLEVLRGFARDHGLSIRASPTGNGAAQAWNAARLDGWIRAESGREFLEQLASAYQFQWFVANGTLYISARADSTVERIALHGMPADAAQAALAAVGLYDERFGWGALAAHDAVLVSGPREYVALLRRFLAARNESSRAVSRAEPMIFPLRYSPATDADGVGRGERIRPGVASIIRQLVAHSEAADATPFFVPAIAPASPSVNPAAVDGLAQLLGLSAPMPPLPTSPPSPLLPSPRSSSMRLAPARNSAFLDIDTVVVGDERSNTVIVWGDPALRGALERIVETLDQPMPMVSMELLVVETDDATIRTLAATEAPHRDEAAGFDMDRLRADFDARLSLAIDAQRVKVLNRQTLVGMSNLHVTLAIGAEESHRRPALGSPHAGTGEYDDNAGGRAGNRGDALDLVARLLPTQSSGRSAIAVDVGLLMAQPTGLPGQEWSNTTSVRLKTAVAIEEGAPPRLLASYPVATSRDRQRAVFVSANTL